MMYRPKYVANTKDLISVATYLWMLVVHAADEAWKIECLLIFCNCDN